MRTVFALHTHKCVVEDVACRITGFLRPVFSYQLTTVTISVTVINRSRLVDGDIEPGHLDDYVSLYHSPGVMRPAFSASSIMLLPILSLTLLQGSIDSNFSRMVAWQSTAKRLSLI